MLIRPHDPWRVRWRIARGVRAVRDARRARVRGGYRRGRVLAARPAPAISPSGMERAAERAHRLARLISSSMRLQTPADDSAFLRVFGSAVNAICTIAGAPDAISRFARRMFQSFG